MRFYQTRDGERFKYLVEDVFGTIVITSERRLNPRSLDDIVLGILRSGATEGTVTKWISFTFDRRPVWDEEEEAPHPEPAEDTFHDTGHRVRSALNKVLVSIRDDLRSDFYKAKKYLSGLWRSPEKQ
jgi:hypothetical protein